VVREEHVVVVEKAQPLARGEGERAIAGAGSPDVLAGGFVDDGEPARNASTTAREFGGPSSTTTTSRFSQVWLAQEASASRSHAVRFTVRMRMETFGRGSSGRSRRERNSWKAPSRRVS